jgi:hypothetical protein
MSTQSAAKVFSEIWDKWDDIAAKAGCALASVAAKNPALYVDCVEKVGKLDDLAKQMVSFWNQQAGNGWATLGPRRLDLGTDLDGKLVSIGDRMFITPAPLDSDKVSLKFRERDGKSHTSLTVSRVAPNGAVTKLYSKDFNDTTSEKKDDDEHVTVPLSGVRGYLLWVLLNSKSATNSLSYTLRVDPQ